MEARVVIPAGLRRCDQCDELRGRTYLPEPHNGSLLGPVSVSCLCEGIVCRYCREHAIHRPISNYFYEETGRAWHVPWFGYLRPCRECSANGVRARP